MTRNEQPGFDPGLYDADFYVWTQRQAAALRAMPRDVVSREVDIEHIAEEIEFLGKRELREVKSYLGRLAEHLLKLDADRSSQDIQHWRDEARLFAAEAKNAYLRSMRQHIDLAAIWQFGVSLSQGYLSDRSIAYDAPAICPFDLDDALETTAFDLDAALAKLAAARDTPRP